MHVAIDENYFQVLENWDSSSKRDREINWSASEHNSANDDMEDSNKIEDNCNIELSNTEDDVFQQNLNFFNLWKTTLQNIKNNSKIHHCPVKHVH